MERPSRYDMVALMVPAGADPVATPPAKHKWCSEAHSHLTEGAGTLTCAFNAFPRLRSLLATAQPSALAGAGHAFPKPLLCHLPCGAVPCMPPKGVFHVQVSRPRLLCHEGIDVGTVFC